MYMYKWSMVSGYGDMFFTKFYFLTVKKERSVVPALNS